MDRNADVALCHELPNLNAAYEQLLAEFDVNELLRSNFWELLVRLVDNGLLHVLPANVGAASAI
jgi:hypothetical protein